MLQKERRFLCAVNLCLPSSNIVAGTCTPIPVRINTISSPELAIWLAIMPFEPKSSSESRYFK